MRVEWRVVRGWRGVTFVAWFAGCAFEGRGVIGEDAVVTGDGNADGAGADAPPPPPCTLELGSDHSCIFDPGGTVRCFGSNANGELGRGPGASSGAAMMVPLGSPARTAAGRSYHTCAGLEDGTVRCWGFNDRQQLGDGTALAAADPIVVSNLTGVVEVAVGRSFSCARRAEGSVTCWGENASGQLGDGTTANHATPVTNVALPGPPTSLSGGSSAACALMPDATGWCWGSNAYGQLGDPSLANHPTPIKLPVDDLVAIAIGGYSTGNAMGGQTCVVRADSTVWCWGSNQFGQLGNGGVSVSEPTPTRVTSLAADVVELAMGRYHVCARHRTGAVSCWGNSDFGQIGDGGASPRPTPVSIALPRPAIHVGAGGFHTCAFLDDHSLYCWGNNGSGQLGDGTATSRPSPVVSLPTCQPS